MQEQNKLIKRQTYRLIAAYFFAVLIAQVFIFQGVHLYFGQHDHHETCTAKDIHISSEGHGHLTCSICLYHITASELHEDELSLNPLCIFHNEIGNCGQKYHFDQKFLQAYLRGPPSLFA